ncbi:phage head spike fiber domain-containing protein [Marinibacterium profundimaris]|uniref:Uncharacterized protein n=1 Tax=Marinibacterium profundimaris TaxID=1679460 RepID=A0A225NVB5_9RHOB|nr:hypothetical protein [Marinibacterium profundimaris]OWU77278.1 hypothetical protein ATO3_00630 [Marinibacterium profundimaris]
MADFVTGFSRSPFLVQRPAGSRNSAFSAYAVNGVAPRLVSDFAAGLYLDQGGVSDVATLFGGCDRSGPATQYDSDGRLVWAPHNLAVNSGSPAAQDIAVEPGARYTVGCSGNGTVTLSGAGTGSAIAGAPVSIVAASATLSLAVTGAVAQMWCHRSDLGGMAPVPKGVRPAAGLESCLPTGGAPRYMMRSAAYLPAPGIFWIGDSFLNGDLLPIETMALVEPNGLIPHETDGVGGSNLQQQATRFAGADPAMYERTLVIMDGGLTDSAAQAMAAIDDMVGRLGHDRWIYVQPAPFSAPDAGMLQTWADIRDHVGEAHYVPTWEGALALSDGSPEDEARVADGLWPLSLTESETDFHANAAGRSYLAAQIHAKLLARGDIGNPAARVRAGLQVEPATSNLLEQTAFASATPPGWTVFVGSGTRSLTELYGAPAIRFTCAGQRDALYQPFTLAPNTTYTASARVSVLADTLGPVMGIYNLSDATAAGGSLSATLADRDAQGYVTITFTTGTDIYGDLRFGVGLDAGRTGDVVISEVQLEPGSRRTSHVPSLAGPAVRAADPVPTIPAARLPSAGGMPDAICFAIRGRMSYRDTGNALEVRPLTWQGNSDNFIHYYLRTDGASTGQPQMRHKGQGVTQDVTGPTGAYAPGEEVAFSLGSRLSAEGINAAIDGVALGGAASVAMPDLAASNLQLGQTFTGYISCFAMWDTDIGDAGLEEATG